MRPRRGSVRHRCRWGALSIYLLALSLVSTPVPALGLGSDAPPPPSSPDPAGLCAILSAGEVSTGLGVSVTIVEDTRDGCVFATAPEAGSRTGLAASRERTDPLVDGPLMDQLRATFPDAADTDVLGIAALATPSHPLLEGWTQAQLILFPDPATMLFLTIVLPEGRDAAATLRALAALVVPRL